MWEKDLAVESPLPWYLPLDKSYFSLSTFRLTAVGRFITKNMVIFVSFKYLLAIVDFLFSCLLKKVMVLCLWYFQFILVQFWNSSLLELTYSFLQVMALEFVGLAPRGSQRVQNFLAQAAEGLVEGGKWVIHLILILLLELIWELNMFFFFLTLL